MLDQVFDALREPVIVLDVSGRPLRIHRAAYELVGIPPREMDGADFLALLRQVNARSLDGTPLRLDDLPSRDIIAGCEPMARGSFVLTPPNREDVYLEATASSVIHNHRLTAIVVVLRDVTAARRADARLQRLIRTLRAHSHTDAAALRAKDETGYLVEACRVIVDDCSYPMAWIGIAEHDEERTVRPVAHAGVDEGYVAQLRVTWADTDQGRGPTGTAIRTGEVCECRDMAADPRVALWRDRAIQRGWASSIALPLAVGDEVLGALTVYFREPGALPADEVALLRDLARDIADGIRVLRLRTAETEARERLRRQAEELARADRMKDEFLATLSHELRTPLSTILVWAHLLLNADLDAEAHRRAEEAILRNAEAQRELINDILDVSRIVSGKLRLEVGQVALRDILAAAVDVVRPAAEAKRINIVVKADGDLAMTADAARLQQALWNLLSNAVKFTPEGGTVTVELENDGTSARVRVSDTGVGISPAFLPHVFERFTQQDSSASRQHGGLGLGLAIARHLLELHGATVTAESEGEGRGSVFTVTLPVRVDGAGSRGTEGPGEDYALQAGSPDTQPLLGIRVLAVDDDADARELFATALGVLGAEVVVTASAAEAIDQLRSGLFDILLADIGMPSTDGYGLIKQVRALPAKTAGIPAIAVTAFGRQQDRARVLAAGYQAHLAKPVLPDQLAAAIVWFVAQADASGRVALSSAPKTSGL
jgi:signal transduction histidine kinase/ActR/RegA family two-component response regulator